MDDDGREVSGDRGRPSPLVVAAGRVRREVRRRLAVPYPTRFQKRYPAEPPFPAAQLGEIAFAYREATASMRVLPDFVVIGAAKSATTSLHRYLMAHPDVFPPLEKEIRYFHFHYDRGPRWYRAHFPTRAAMAAHARRHGRTARTFEASTGYISSPDVPERAAALIPRARFVALLREPVDRAISHYAMLVRAGVEARPIEEALTPDGGYVRLGQYVEQLERWYAHFASDQILVRQSEAFTADPAVGLAEICAFVGLEAPAPARYDVFNAGRYEDAPPALREQLLEHFAPYNEQLFELLGTRFDWAAPTGRRV